MNCPQICDLFTNPGNWIWRWATLGRILCYGRWICVLRENFTIVSEKPAASVFYLTDGNSMLLFLPHYLVSRPSRKNVKPHALMYCTYTQFLPGIFLSGFQAHKLGNSSLVRLPNLYSLSCANGPCYVSRTSASLTRNTTTKPETARGQQES
jgi:hypothetical protein